MKFSVDQQGCVYVFVAGQLPAGRAVRGEGILNTSVAYYLPYGSLRHDPNPEEECLQSQVEVGSSMVLHAKCSYSVSVLFLILFLILYFYYHLLSSYC